MTKNAIAAWITATVLGMIYLLLLSSASNGYGYMGYNGYSSGPSSWNWGGPHDVYYERDVRNGSRSGPHSIGGGPGSGK